MHSAMMRYQRLGPDFLPQPNSDQIYNADLLQIGSGSGSGSGSATQTEVTINNNHDLLLKWGHKKRSRCSRTSSAEDSCSNPRRNTKIQKRAAAIVGAEKIAAVAASEMPPPTNSRTCVQSNGTIHHDRTIEDKSNGHPRPEKKRSPSSSSLPNHHHNGFGSPASAASMNPDPKPQPEHDSSGTGSGSMAVEKTKLEWPRIYVTLSRKEKEDDFFALKGTKLPHRPKKRAKNIDKAIQYCYPGMWLSDLTRGRYEVREKKCAKKKQRLGLKGLESMDSDSE